MEIHGTKVCFSCKQEKIKLAFSACSNNKDGLYHICRDCRRIEGKRKRSKKQKTRTLKTVRDPYS